VSGNSFLNAFMPVLPWLILVIGLLVAWVFLVIAWIRRWNAQRHQVERPGKALSQAKDALATVISDPAVFGDARNQALSAYASVADALKQTKRSVTR
jgi:hypothetical protein